MKYFFFFANHTIWNRLKLEINICDLLLRRAQTITGAKCCDKVKQIVSAYTHFIGNERARTHTHCLWFWNAIPCEVRDVRSPAQKKNAWQNFSIFDFQCYSLCRAGKVMVVCDDDDDGRSNINIFIRHTLKIHNLQWVGIFNRQD